jgi:hypothetical protein
LNIAIHSVADTCIGCFISSRGPFPFSFSSRPLVVLGLSHASVERQWRYDWTISFSEKETRQTQSRVSDNSTSEPLSNLDPDCQPIIHLFHWIRGSDPECDANQVQVLASENNIGVKRINAKGISKENLFRHIFPKWYKSGNIKGEGLSNCKYMGKESLKTAVLSFARRVIVHS